MSRDLIRLAAARAVALAALALAELVFGTWLYIGPLYYLLNPGLVGLVVVLSLVLRGPRSDGLCLALCRMALWLPWVALGLELAQGVAGPVEQAMRDLPCGPDAPLVASWLGPGSNFLGPLAGLALAAVVVLRSRRSLPGVPRSLALALVASGTPALLLVAGRVLLAEHLVGGVGLLVLYPLAWAAAGCSLSWLLRRPSPATAALQQAVPLWVASAVLLAPLLKPSHCRGWTSHFDLLSWPLEGPVLLALAAAVFAAPRFLPAEAPTTPAATVLG
jgi:hypothetical protein